MRIYVSGATATLRRLVSSATARQFLGVLVTPQNGNRLGSLVNLGLPLACDNSAYSNPDERKFWNMGIDQWEGQSLADWVTVPDVVADHEATLRMFHGWIDQWEYEIGHVPFRLAFVLQNGATIDSVPWDRISAVFVGGDNHFKLRGCHDLCFHAQKLGKLVHVGRVNSPKRLRYAYDLGADSVDGSGFSMFPDSKIIPGIKYLRSLEKQSNMFW